MWIPYAAAYNTLIIRDNDTVLFQNITKGIQNTCDCAVDTITLAESDHHELKQKIANTGSGIIVAIGKSSISKALQFRDKRPLITTGIVDSAALPGPLGVFSVGITVALNTQLQIIHDILPDTQKIGLIYTSALAASIERELTTLPKSLKSQLVLVKVEGLENIPGALSKLRGNCNALLLVPDLNIITTQTLNAFALFSVENNVPLITFSPRHLKDGALVSISAAPLDIGKEAGRIAKLAAAGASPPSANFITHPVIEVNYPLASKLHVRIAPPRSYTP